ncbi:MAG TPA: DUF2339 domain-containing protein [Vicinamibacterales bacterium]|nr:DUF2339 domain-containing protein [Vicinamibacterales bacterium]
MLFLVLLAAVPFVLPIVAFLSLAGVRRRLAVVEELLEQQQRALDDMTKRLRQTRHETAEARVDTAPAPEASKEAPPPPAVAPRLPLAAPPRVVAPPPVVVPPANAAPRSAVDEPDSAGPPHEAFDWERLVGVRMFSAVAGIALVLAAVFFLRYSIDHGWLAPPVRLAIGVLTGIALLVGCELKAARNYRVTANALDAAAIAILFATFFAAHALWHLIPSTVAFGLLTLVTAVAALLSIRRDSLFIAVLGLLGGFATPALLSTGENRPISLFTYLLLLNIGLAWVASRKRWSILTICTLAFTTVYQWGWVIRFLSAGQLPLAMGIFTVFAVTGFVSLAFGRRSSIGSSLDRKLKRTGLAAATMPLLFAIYLAAVPAYGSRAGLLFGFMLLIDVALLAVAIGQDDEVPHAIGATATLAVFAIWLAVSYASSAWTTAVAFVAASVVLFLAAPMVAERVRHRFTGVGALAVYAAPTLLFVFTVIARIEPAAATPWGLFAPLFTLLALLAWRALATGDMALYFIAAFFGVAAEGSWSSIHLTIDHLSAALQLYAAFALFYLGVPLVARRTGRALTPAWGGGAVLIASLLMLLFLASGSQSGIALWGLAVLLALLDAGIFIESAAGALPWLSVVGGALSWLVLAVWWRNAAGAVGLLPSLLVLVLLTLVMLAGHAWAHTETAGTPATIRGVGFRQGTYLGLLGHAFLFFIAVQPQWSVPPWPLFGALCVLTLAVSAASLAVEASDLHAAGAIAAAVVVYAWARVPSVAWSGSMLAAGEAVVAYALVWPAYLRKGRVDRPAAIAAAVALFIAEFTTIQASGAGSPLPAWLIVSVNAANLSLILWVAWLQEWAWVAPAAVVPAWLAAAAWQTAHPLPADWRTDFALALSAYAVFAAYPFMLGGRARETRDPHLTAVAGSAFFFFAARAALEQGGLDRFVGAVPIGEGLVMALLLRMLLQLEPSGARDVGRLAVVAGTALAFATVAIPLQLHHQWITIGWALEGVALAWVYRRIPHRGLLLWGVALLSVVFVRLALNPAVFVYEPRGARMFNWYLYTYAIAGVSMLAASWWLSTTKDEIIPSLPRASALLPAGGVILLFLLLNIEIADFFAAGPSITFRFGVTLAQDLTYTIGWLVFGMALLTGGISLHHRGGRITAIALIAITACKGFLYDMGSLGGLYRVASLVGLAVSLSLVALALQKFVLHASKDQA